MTTKVPNRFGSLDPERAQRDLQEEFDNATPGGASGSTEPLTYDAANSNLAAGIYAYNDGVLRKSTQDSDYIIAGDGDPGPFTVDVSGLPDGETFVFYDFADEEVKVTQVIDTSQGLDHFVMARFSVVGGAITEASIIDFASARYSPALYSNDCIRDLGIKGISGTTIIFEPIQARGYDGNVATFPDGNVVILPGDWPFSGNVYMDIVGTLSYVAESSGSDDLTKFKMCYVEIDAGGVITLHEDKRELWRIGYFLSLARLRETKQTVASSAGVLTIDIRKGLDVVTTLTENITTVHINNWPRDGVNAQCVLTVIYGGSFSISGSAWGSPVFWANGNVAPTSTAVLNDWDRYVFSCDDGGDTRHADVVGQSYNPPA